MVGGGASLDPFRSHGGRIEAARAAFPGALPWVDLSTGISPWAYPAAIDPSALARLPAPEALAALEAAAATCFGTGEAVETVAVPGSDLALRLLGRLFPNRTVAVVRPGYSGHVTAWEGAPVSAISADRIEEAAERFDIVLLANPNNPDGRIIARERLLAVSARLAWRGGWLIVDEAFADAAPETSLGGECGEGLILLRSFGKFFGLAGLRLGFLIAPPAIAMLFRAMLGDWPLSGPAITIGKAAYRDRDWQAAQRIRISEAAGRLDALLGASGLELMGGTSLFRLVLSRDADALFRHLAARAILTRPFAAEPDRLRIGLPGNEEQWARLAAALDGWRMG
ncbi:threonine-phosphate decarboxylase [Sphingomonas oleivorans]|uniref:threonine-phosphate decarboxylase n=1 Tax=Sphingomonas oleivorans TaxID=1735121 RepID=A0A2T5G286_9SPHN|nr:threonine-phosphate decarboxylase CobD [Sphingomonas oleivorans]PTQ13267.1 threonine-phosphate decarboxylase [Sphingomonas oleivorans]